VTALGDDPIAVVDDDHHAVHADEMCQIDRRASHVRHDAPAT